MRHTESVRYLEQAGFHYKPAESPDLWGFLEGHFAGPQSIGPKFTPMPASFVAELINLGEEALLEAMVLHHKQTGTPGLVARVIDMPYVIGTAASIPLAEADASRLLRLIDQPGTAREHIIHVVPATADEIPSTSHMTAIGGVYSDGRTAGYFDLLPGERLEASAHGKMEGALAYYATPAEIAGLAREMEARAEDISVITRGECDAMIAKAKKILR